MSVRALTVDSWGATPKLLSTTLPAPTATQTRVRMVASGFANLVRSQAAGTHYSVPRSSLPYIPGVDGVGYTPDEKLVFITTLSASPAGGTFASEVNVETRAMVPIASTSRDIGIKTAALVNPTMSSWMALKYRAHISTLTKPTVLILGATSASGRIAAVVARSLGAGSVIGVARGEGALADMKARGVLDHYITLGEKTDYSILSSGQSGTFPNIVLDYVWGSAALELLEALPKSARDSEDYEVRYVHIGTLSKQPEIAISGATLRSKNVVISGSGPGSWSLKALAKELPGIVDVIRVEVPETWKEECGVIERTLDQVDEAWADVKGRTVFVM